MRIELVRKEVVHSRSLVQPIDFRVASRASNVFSLPAWMSLVCATTGRTVQTSASTLATSLGANAARARSVDGTSWGLSLEHAATNYVKVNGDFTNTWSVGAGAITVASATDPSGGSSNCSLNDTSAASASFMLMGGLTIPGTGNVCPSMWIKALTTGTVQVNINLTGASSILHAGIDASWVRKDVTFNASSTSGNMVVEPLNSAALTGIALCYGLQVELGKYPSSLLLTTGSTVARAADVLSATASAVASGGFFDVNLVVAPNYASTEQSNDHDLFFLDSNNRVFLQQSTSKVVLRIGGADVTSSALTWSRNQELAIRAVHSRKLGRMVVVSGATTGNGSATGSATSAVTLGSTAYVLGNASGPEEAADLRAINFARAA